MSLKEKLEATKAASAGRLPDEKRAVMARSVADLRQSGIIERSKGVGQTAPGFALPNHDGAMISSSDLLSKGPLVVSFFRGAW